MTLTLLIWILAILVFDIAFVLLMATRRRL